MSRNNIKTLISGISGGLLIYSLYNLACRVTQLEYEVLALKYYK